jgi:putative protease
MLKKSKKKVAKKKTAAKKKGAAKKPKTPKHAGVVTHFYGEIGVAIVKFNKKVPVGAKLAFKGATTDFVEIVKSMQYDHKPIATAPKGKQVGIKVKNRVREGDKVHLAK